MKDMAAAQSLLFTVFGGAAAYTGQIRNGPYGIASKHNMCLDIENVEYQYHWYDIPKQSQVQLWGCNGQWNQDWEFSSGSTHGKLISAQTPMSHRMCLSYLGSAVPGSDVQLDYCSVTNAQWNYDPTTNNLHLVGPGNLCLGICKPGEICGCDRPDKKHCGHAYPNNYAMARLEACSTTGPLVWELPGPHPPTHPGQGLQNIHAPHNSCLDIENKGYAYDPATINLGAEVQLWVCNQKWNQHWTLDASTNWKLMNTESNWAINRAINHQLPNCVGVKAGDPIGTYTESRLELVRCSVAPQWQWFGVQQIQLMGTGQCLAIDTKYWLPSWPKNRARAVLTQCDPTDVTQKWKFINNLDLVV